MYLNVSLTPPPSATEGGSCSTPKTPEILNSIMSLTGPPLPPTYAHYQNQVATGDLLSPASSTNSPCEEVSATQFGYPLGPVSGQNAPACSKSIPGGSYVMSRPRTFSSGTLSSTGTPSPPVPELPSPVNTVEATKRALIKEGLKHQIRSKLKAAGVGHHDLFHDVKSVKEEQTQDEELTVEDEDKRYRRRERNKIAATKCRNKKKERTIILMSESEIVEDQNIKLKSEIKRLEKERLHLEKLLSDPAHRTSCRHSSKGCSSNIPMVVVTPPDAPDAATTPPLASGLSPNSSSPPSTCTSSSITDSITSKAGQADVSYCPKSLDPMSTPCIYEPPHPYVKTPALGISSYDISLPAEPKASDAYTSLSPPNMLPFHSSAQPTCISNTPHSGDQSLVRESLVSTYSHLTTAISSHPTADPVSLHKEGREHHHHVSNSLVPIKPTVTPNKRYLPYQVIRHSTEASIGYPSSKCTNNYEGKVKESDIECYLPVTTEEEQIQGSLYMYPHQITLTPEKSTKDVYTPIMKTKAQSWHTPYNSGQRTNAAPILTELQNEYDNVYYQQGGTCSENATQIFTDSNQNHYYPQCNF